MNITSAKYIRDNTTESTENILIFATIDGVDTAVPLTLDNRHYSEIMKQVDAGELTIEPADE